MPFLSMMMMMMVMMYDVMCSFVYGCYAVRGGWRKRDRGGQQHWKQIRRGWKRKRDVVQN